MTIALRILATLCAFALVVGTAELPTTAGNRGTKWIVGAMWLVIAGAIWWR